MAPAVTSHSPTATGGTDARGEAMDRAVLGCGGSLLGGLHLGFVTGRIARPVKSRRFKFQQLLGHPQIQNRIGYELFLLILALQGVEGLRESGARLTCGDREVGGLRVERNGCQCGSVFGHP